MDQNLLIERNNKIKEAGKATRDRRAMMECKVYQLKIDTSRISERQKEHLQMLFVESKWLFNHILSFSNKENQTVFDYKLEHNITKRDKDGNDIDITLQWTSSHIRQSILEELRENIRGLNQLKRNGYTVGQLKFKSEVKSINLKQYNNTWKFTDDRHIKIQGIKGKIKVFGINQFKDIEGIEYANAKILNLPTGYYVNITTYQPKQEKQYIDDIIGIDFGCADTVTLNDGRKFDVYVEETERLKTLQRKLTRQVKGSNRYRKTQHAIQVQYQKINNRRNDIANKLVHMLTSYKTVIIQDDNFSSWKNSEFNSKSIQHSILGRLKSKLKVKENVIVLNRFVPTTKLCTKCGKYHHMPTNVRTFKCDCGVILDRDIHAAQNMIWMYKNNIGLERADSKLDYTQIKDEIAKAIASENLLTREDSSF